MIKVRMGEEDVACVGVWVGLFGECSGVVYDSAAGIEDDIAVTDTNDDAGGCTAVACKFSARDRDAAAATVNFDGEV